MNRFAQFVVALARRGGLSEAQTAWVDKHLSAEERALFWQMSPSDQRHAVAVSMKASALAKEAGLGERERLLLIRAGLLHDIGKVSGEAGLFARAWAVVARALAPGLVARWGRKAREELLEAGRAGLMARMRRAFHTCEVHPARGAAMAALWGVEEEVVDLIRRHHQSGSGPLSDLLAAADRSS